MTYALAGALQAAVYRALVADAALGALVGGAIHDALPGGMVPDLYVALGPEVVRDRSDATGAGAEHEFTITVVSNAAGFAAAKAAAGAVSDVLSGADLALERGRLVFLVFHKAQARRARSGAARRIDLIFRARVEEV